MRPDTATRRAPWRGGPAVLADACGWIERGLCAYSERPDADGGDGRQGQGGRGIDILTDGVSCRPPSGLSRFTEKAEVNRLAKTTETKTDS